MSYDDHSGIRLVYGGVAAEEEEKEEAGAARAPDHRIEPTLIRSAVEEGVEPLGHNNVVNDTNLPMQTRGNADLFAAVDGPAYKNQAMNVTQPSATSPLPILNEQLKSDIPHDDASLLTGAGDGEAVMIDAHYFGNGGTNANLGAQSGVLDGNVYDADAFA